MKKKRLLFIHSLVILVLILPGCKGSSNAKMPDIGISEGDMNMLFSLSAPEGGNTFKIGDPILIVVDVTSNYMISFPGDFGARLFVLDGGTWVETPNKEKYSDEKIVLYPSEGNIVLTAPVFIQPDLSGFEEEVSLRVILIGNIVQDGFTTEDKAAAFIDLELNP